jgi:hypothetical protein
LVKNVKIIFRQTERREVARKILVTHWKILLQCDILIGMKSFSLPRSAAAALLLFIFSAIPLKADSLFSSISWSFRGTILMLAEDNDLESDPMPVLPVFGLAADMPLPIQVPVFGPLYLEASLDIYYTNFGYSDKLERAVPLAIENRWVQVYGFVLGTQALVRYKLTDLMTVRAFAGFSYDLRLCMIAADLNDYEMDEAARQTDAVTDYFWGQARWLLPNIGGGLDFVLNEKFLLGVDLRIWAPVYKLWTGEHIPSIDGFRFGFGIKCTIR